MWIMSEGALPVVGDTRGLSLRPLPKPIENGPMPLGLRQIGAQSETVYLPLPLLENC
jgi:hypothetical protein